MHTYTYTFIWIHIHIHLYEYIWIYIYMNTYTYTFTWIHIHIHLYEYIYIYIYMNTYTYTFTSIHIHIHLYEYIYIYIYKNTYTYAFIWIHIHMISRESWVMSEHVCASRRVRDWTVHICQCKCLLLKKIPHMMIYMHYQIYALSYPFAPREESNCRKWALKSLLYEKDLHVIQGGEDS